MSNEDILLIFMAISQTRLEMEVQHKAGNVKAAHEAWTRLEALKTAATSENIITEILCKFAMNQQGMKKAS